MSVMLEPHRSRYLRALGVDIYVPRQSLPGAALSQPVGWAVDVDVADAANTVSIALPATLDVEPATTQRDVPVNVRSALPDLDTATKGRVKGAEKQSQPIIQTGASKVEAPRFSLLISRSEAGLLVVDEGPRSDQRRDEYLRLMSNLLFALYRRPVVIESDLFVWPMVKNPLVDQSEQAARESLGAYLQRQCTLSQGTTLVALGAGPSQWMNDNPVFHIISGVSLWRCLSDSSVKGTLWQQLQPLRAMSH